MSKNTRANHDKEIRFPSQRQGRRWGSKVRNDSVQSIYGDRQNTFPQKTRPMVAKKSGDRSNESGNGSFKKKVYILSRFKTALPATRKNQEKITQVHDIPTKATREEVEATENSEGSQEKDWGDSTPDTAIGNIDSPKILPDKKTGEQTLLDLEGKLTSKSNEHQASLAKSNESSYECKTTTNFTARIGLNAYVNELMKKDQQDDDENMDCVSKTLRDFGDCCHLSHPLKKEKPPGEK